MSKHFLIILFIASICYPTLGIEVARQFWISPILVISAIWFVFTFKSQTISTFILSILGIILLIIDATLETFSLSSLLGIFAFIIAVNSTSLISNIEGKYYKVLRISWIVQMTLLILYILYSFKILPINLTILESEKVPHNYYFFYYRPKLFFPEPAYLGLYFAILSNILLKKTDKFLSFIAVCLTGSFLGIGVSIYLYFRKNIKHLLILVFLILVFGVTLLNKENFIIERAVKTLNAVVSGDVSSSEGSRINSIWIGKDLLFDGNIENNFFGPGWSQTEKWIVNNYKILPKFSSISRGDIDNLLSALLLKTGIIGTIIVLLIVVSNSFNITKNIIRILFSILVFSFTTGVLVHPFVWALFLLFILDDKQFTLHPN